MQVLKKKIAEKLRKTPKAKHRICYEHDVYATTVDNWIDKNNQGEETKLVSPTSLKAISEEFNIPQSDLLTETN